jgi:hypothetical protein
MPGHGHASGHVTGGSSYSQQLDYKTWSTCNFTGLLRFYNSSVLSGRMMTSLKSCGTVFAIRRMDSMLYLLTSAAAADLVLRSGAGCVTAAAGTASPLSGRFPNGSHRTVIKAP